MTCHEAREQFSALVDDALGAGERAALDAHLATCADCRRELQRFRDTVSLLHAVGPIRAPAGFVDRVLETARPIPWPRRLVRGLFLPWPVKLPMEAAAVVLVAVGVALVYRGTPELQQAARLETPAPAIERAPESPGPPGPVLMSREHDAARESSGARRDQAELKEQARALAKTREAKDMTERPKASESQPAQTQTTDQTIAAGPAPAKTPERERPSSDVEMRQKMDRLAVEPPAPATAGKLAARSEAPRAQAPPQATASLAFAPSDVQGLLEVGDRDVALRQVAELISRLGATETRRVDGTSGPIVELTISRESYPELARELGRVGRWRTTREPAALPAQVRVMLQITS
jgi:Putative zinc-finger